MKREKDFKAKLEKAIEKTAIAESRDSEAVGAKKDLEKLVKDQLGTLL